VAAGSWVASAAGRSSVHAHKLQGRPFLLPEPNNPSSAPILEDRPRARENAGRGSIVHTEGLSRHFSYNNRVKSPSKPSVSRYERLENEKQAIIKAFNSVGYTSYAAQIQACGKECLVFRHATCGTTFGRPRSCYSRFCPVCAERRAARILKKKLPVLAQYQNYVFLTLTMPSVKVMTDAYLQLAYASWNKLYHRKFMQLRCHGAITSLEVTYGEKGFHPHLHILIAIRHRYLPIEPIRQAWYEYTGANWCHIEKPKPPLANAIRELVKYPLKPVSFYHQPEALGQYALAIQGLKLIRGYGCFAHLAESFKGHGRLSDIPCPRCGGKDFMEKIGDREPLSKFIARDWGLEYMPNSPPGPVLTGPAPPLVQFS
jgi:hypothetical protein